MKIQEIIDLTQDAGASITTLREKTISVPVWAGAKGLEAEYNPAKHPVMNKQLYPDEVAKDGIIRVTRVPLDLQRLACKRMTELTCGIPIKRVYKPENDKQKEISKYIEKIFEKNRIDAVNNDRINTLFASCEVMTLWYGIKERNSLYGFDSELKLRCKNYSPMAGDDLYPLFDEFGDMIALSIGYARKKGRKNVQYFDTYTSESHAQWSNENGGWELVGEIEDISLMKIPAVYMYRPTPIWEKTSPLVYELEWQISRNGNYLRKNMKPIFAVFADEIISYGDEQDDESRSVVQYPKGTNAGYLSWQQAIENLKFHTGDIRQWFFTMLQLPDWSYDKMSQIALSGESRKQLFIDAQMKVQDESGRLIEFFSREVNVVKAFLKVMLPDSYANDIDALDVEIIITPFTISEEKDTISNLVLANGNKPIISQRESIEMLGWSTDVDKTLQEITEENKIDAFQLTE